MKKQIVTTALACAFFAFMPMQGAQASETAVSKSQAQANKKAVKKKAGGSSVKFVPGSQETKAERSARLTRECRGAVNAGACEGYTR